MARSTVAVKFTGDTAALKRSIDDADGKLNNLGSKLGNLGKSVAVGVGAGAVALGALGKVAVDAGSNLNETLSKSNTVFGEQAFAIESWANAASSAFGQSKQQALEAASSFGNMFSQLGIGDQQAADMSKSMTELASDFASFHNADITEVLTAQQAAFRGEYDAVQRFVPTINAAAVEQKALEMGLADSTKELDAQDKALATQALLMEGAGDAAGDFARTSDGLANKQRIMSARFEDVKAKIGQGLIPVVSQLVGFVSDRLIPAFQDFTSFLTSPFDEAPRNKMEALGASARDIAERFGQLAAVVREHWPQIQAVIVSAVQGVQSVVTPIVGALQALWENFGNNILEFVQRVWPAIQQVIEAALNIIQGVVKTVTSLIQGDWANVWEGIKQTFYGVWNAIQGILRTAVEALRGVLGIGLEVLGSMFKAAWDGIVGFFGGVPGRISSIARGMWDGIKDAFRSAINWIIRAWNGLEFSIPGFDPPGPGPTFGGFTLGVPNIPTLHKGGTVTATGVEPLRSDERYAKLQVGETVYPKGASAGVTINVGTLNNATLADLEQSVAFMFAARGL